MLTTLEIWLLQKAMDAATSPESKGWCIAELKKLESYTANVYLKAALHGLETFLAERAA